MAESRVVVAGLALRGRRLLATGAAGSRIVSSEQQVLAGAGAIAAVAAAGTTSSTGVHVDLVARVGADEAGTWCLAELIGRGVDVARITRWGTTGEYLVIEAPTGEEDVVLVPGEVDADGVGAALADCRPGDVLLVDSSVIVRHPEIVEDAYDADLQVIADLRPVLPGALDADVVARLDVVVVDAAGAGAVADAFAPPASLAVYAGGLGSWWDDLRHEPEETSSLRPVAPSDDGVHRFAGALAAALAGGLDRPEAFSLALTAAMGRIEA